MAGMLKAMSTAKTYRALQDLVQSVSYSDLEIPDYYMEIEDFAIDANSLPLVPPDTAAVPMDIIADGNCLPRCGSVFAFHTQDHHQEIRVRIIAELVLHEDFYLSDALDTGGQK